MSWLFELDKVNDWAYWDNAFSPEECEQIINLALSKNKLEKGKISSEKDIDVKIRNNSIVWLDSTEDNMNWIYERLSYIILELNKSYFDFNLYGMTEKLQFTQYESPNEFYKKHIDKTNGNIIRKLTIVLQLTDENSYEGSDLLLHNSGSPIKSPRKQGTIIAFPSYTLHEVTPIVKGIRHSLVSWISGPNFK